MEFNGAISQLANRNIFCGRTKAEALFDMPNNHCHNHYEIYYLISGERKYFAGNQIYNVHKGDIVLIQKGVLHRTTQIGNGYHKRLLISFNDEMLCAEFESDIERCFERCFYDVPDMLAGAAEALLFKIENEFKTDDKFSERLLKGYLLEFFMFLIRNDDKIFADSTRTKTDCTVQKTAEYISGNCEKNITLTETAKLMAVSHEHLSRKFKKVTGFGFNEYLTIMRVMRSESLLLSTKLPITEIALRCGFDDSNYFSTVFKKVKGVSPNKFRNSTAGI